MSRRFQAGATFAVRVPLLPLATVTDAGASGDASTEAVAAQRAWLAAVLARADVREAIFVASPALHAELDAWRAQPDSAHGRKLEHALVKYVTRMATRATPYGLCAGIGVGRVDGRGVELTVAPDARRRRRTRIDNEVLFRLASAIAQTAEARERLAWSANTSLVRVAGRWRYAEARADEKQALRYHLVAIEPTPYLDATIERARGGARLAALAEALAASEDVELAEARDYVDELVAAQVLVPALGVMVTGPEPIDGLIAQLEGANLPGPASALAVLRDDLGRLDAIGGSVDAYAAIAEQLEAMFVAAGASTTIERARLFQVDQRAPVDARLGRDAVAEIERAALALQRMTPRRDDPRLAALRRGFRERWEAHEVPLAEVLDEEAGIGFAAASGPGSEGSPLLAGLPFAAAPGEATTEWAARERWLLGRLAELWTSGGDELVLDDDDVKALAAATPAELPAAWSVLARMGRATGAEEPMVLVEGAGGPSGARLLGRFCHLDPAIEAMVRDHLAREEAACPGVVLAEVAHLADGRTGNILCRPVLRSHELVYLGHSGAPDDARLLLEDLMMSVEGERIVLRSRRLGREVAPRLTSAHNVAAHGLGVYRFLAALQAQDGSSVGWSWGALADAPRLPRVRIGRAVVARASWRLDAGELRDLARGSRAGRRDAFAAVQALRARRRLPRYVVVADGDNELCVDLDHALQADAMVATIAGRERATLTELWPAPGGAVARGEDGAYASELVVTFTREGAPAAKTARAPAAVARDVTRRFAPGSRWLYAKLYGGVSSADRVLRDVVAPVVRGALATGAARRWFFVRYADPYPHLRLRLDGDPARLASETLPALHAATAPLLADGALWRVQLDTYEREVERYGGAAGIELCEDIFGHDAEAALAIVEQLDGDAGAEARWQLALVGAERLLAALGLEAAARERVFARGKESLAAEHHAGAPLQKAIGERWRTHEARLTELLAPGRATHPDEPLAAGLAALDRRDLAVRRLHEDDRGRMIATMTEGSAWSLVHMSCNRLLHASARAQELVIYDLLRRWHGRQRARAALAPEVAA